jgi:hypothetical protein
MMSWRMRRGVAALALVLLALAAGCGGGSTTTTTQTVRQPAPPPAVTLSAEERSVWAPAKTPPGIPTLLYHGIGASDQFADPADAAGRAGHPAPGSMRSPLRTSPDRWRSFTTPDTTR